ncbi:gamma-glutamylcyclotransferase family protein [Gaoshiqia sp. Z1-71]|uniref:gamma-glutamylcyclotransferase family protein n=1 Tax=Gaoshiqia hydrogeniformans TaxID=3290090 RepID=UPI003BF8C2F7
MMKKLLLFTYGTLSDPEFIHLLLNRVPEYTGAILPGYELLVHPQNGYLFVKPKPGSMVKGFFFEIKPDELRLIDCWEEVPLYERELKQVVINDGEETEVFVYTQNQTEGIPWSPDHPVNREKIREELRAFMKLIRE